MSVPHEPLVTLSTFPTAKRRNQLFVWLAIGPMQDCRGLMKYDVCVDVDHRPIGERAKPYVESSLEGVAIVETIAAGPALLGSAKSLRDELAAFLAKALGRYALSMKGRTGTNARFEEAGADREDKPWFESCPCFTADVRSPAGRPRELPLQDETWSSRRKCIR